MQRGPSHGTEPLSSLLQSWRGHMKSIACLVAVSVEQWENASWSLGYLISSQELREANIFGMKQLKGGKMKFHAYCAQPHVLFQAGSRCQT